MIPEKFLYKQVVRGGNLDTKPAVIPQLLQLWTSIMLLQNRTIELSKKINQN